MTPNPKRDRIRKQVIILGIAAVLCAIACPSLAAVSCSERYAEERREINRRYDDSISDVRMHPDRYIIGDRSGVEVTVRQLNKQRDSELEAARDRYNECRKAEMEIETRERAAQRKERQKALEQAAQEARMQREAEREAVQKAFADSLNQQNLEYRERLKRIREQFGEELKTGAAEKAFEMGRQAFEEKTGLTTRVPGESAANELKEYNEHLKGAQEDSSRIAPAVVPGIQRIGNEIDTILNNPSRGDKDNGGMTTSGADASAQHVGSSAVESMYMQSLLEAQEEAIKARQELAQYQAAVAAEQKARETEARKLREVKDLLQAVDALNFSSSTLPQPMPPTQSSSGTEFEDLLGAGGSRSNASSAQPQAGDFLDLLTSSPQAIRVPASRPSEHEHFLDLLKN